MTMENWFNTAEGSEKMREEYVAALENLRTGAIENPSVEDIQKFALHISKDEINALLKEVSDTGRSVYFAAPPVFVRNAHQTLVLDAPYTDKDRTRPLRLSWAYSHRTAESYTDKQLHGDIEIAYPHADKAMEYASKNWGKDLVLDSWKSYVDFHIDDPRDKTDVGHPKTKMVIGVGISRDWNELINDHSRPQSELINSGALVASKSPIVKSEIKGGRGGYDEFNCGNCGGGLALSGCSGCGLTFRDDQWRSGWGTPLPEKLADYAKKNGIDFGVDPKEVRDREKERFESR